MPSFSRNLEETLHRAVAYANQRKHEYTTLEHLLLALIDDSDAAGVMKACEDDLGELEIAVQKYGCQVQRVSRGEAVGQGESLRFVIPSGQTMELVYDLE